jgi:hypothetical protein
MFSRAVYAEPLGNSVTTMQEIGVSAMLPTSLAHSIDTAGSQTGASSIT